MTLSFAPITAYLAQVSWNVLEETGKYGIFCLVLETSDDMEIQMEFLFQRLFIKGILISACTTLYSAKSVLCKCR